MYRTENELGTKQSNMPADLEDRLCATRQEMEEKVEGSHVEYMSNDQQYERRIRRE